MIYFLCGLSLLIVGILAVIYSLLTIKKLYSREKYSTFECGIDLMSTLRLPFSLHFYFVSIVFLIFDVELMLILPFIFCMKLVNLIYILIMIIVLMMILVLGFFYEWWTGLLNWLI